MDVRFRFSPVQWSVLEYTGPRYSDLGRRQEVCAGTGYTAPAGKIQEEIFR